MNKIKEVVNLVHVMHERHPANYSTMDDAVLIYCSVQVIASEIVILYKMKIMQNCAWLKKWKLEDLRRYIFAAAKPRGVFNEKELAEINYIGNTNFGQRSLCWTRPCWSKQNTENHLFSHARNFDESQNRFIVNVFGANQSSNVFGIPYYFLEI